VPAPLALGGAGRAAGAAAALRPGLGFLTSGNIGACGLGVAGRRLGGRRRWPVPGLRHLAAGLAARRGGRLDLAGRNLAGHRLAGLGATRHGLARHVERRLVVVDALTAALPLLDRGDEITLAHAGSVGDAELTGELTQLGEHHAGEAAAAADRGAVVGRLAPGGTAGGLGKPFARRRRRLAAGLAVLGGSIGTRAAQKIGVAHKGPS
jgi:hypothetical protein